MSYQDRIDFRIDSAYTLTTSDLALITEGQNANLKWSDAHYKPFKDAVRSHLRPRQNGRCGFCRLRIPRSQFYPHLEHLVPKGAHSRFEFTPENLVWSCQRCNFGKGTENTLDGSYPNFPQNSDAFLIVNPYHELLSAHIDLIEDLIMIPKTNSTKGTTMIKFYKLDRLEIAEDRAYELKTIDNNLTPAQIIGRLTLRLAKENDSRIINVINRYLPLVNNWIID